MPEGVRVGLAGRDIQNKVLFDVDCCRFGCLSTRKP